MQLKSCLVFLLLGLALSRATSPENKELEVEEVDNDADRSKKSVKVKDHLSRAFHNNIQAIPQPFRTLVPRTQTLDVQARQAAQTLSVQNPQLAQILNIQNPQHAQILSIQNPQSGQTLNIQNQQSVQTSPVQTLSIQPGAPGAVQTLSIQAPQPVQTFNIQPTLQGVKTFSIQAPQSVQALSVQPGSSSVQTLSIQGPQAARSFSIQAPQPVSTVSIQPGSPAVRTFNLVQPQSLASLQRSANVIAVGPRSSNTIQVIQPVQHSPQTNVNILQPTVKEIDSVPVVEKIIRTEKIVEPAPVSETVVVSEVEKEVVAPVAPVYREQVVVKPRYPCIPLSELDTVPAYIKYPKLKYGPKTLSALTSEMMVEQPMSVLTSEHALLGAA